MTDAQQLQHRQMIMSVFIQWLAHERVLDQWLDLLSMSYNGREEQRMDDIFHAGVANNLVQYTVDWFRIQQYHSDSYLIDYEARFVSLNRTWRRDVWPDLGDKLTEYTHEQ